MVQNPQNLAGVWGKYRRDYIWRPTWGHLNKAKTKQKYYYDIKARAAKVKPGDQVLVKILAFDGKHKIADKFEEELYTVIDQNKEDIPVYKLRGNDTGKIKHLHRNHIFLVKHQDEIDTDEIDTVKLDTVETSTQDHLHDNVIVDKFPDRKVGGKCLKETEISDVTLNEDSDDETELLVITSSGDAQDSVPVSEENAVEDSTEGTVRVCKDDVVTDSTENPMRNCTEDTVGVYIEDSVDDEKEDPVDDENEKEQDLSSDTSHRNERVTDETSFSSKEENEDNDGNGNVVMTKDKDPLPKNNN